MKEIIDKIIDRINSSVEISGDDSIEVGDKSVKINKENFNALENPDDFLCPENRKFSWKIKINGKDKKICFVDGGNAEIIKASNFSLQFVRVYYNVFKENRKIKSKRYELFVLVKAVDEDGIKYKVEFFGDDLKLDLSFDSFDKSLRTGENRVKISKVGDVVRRFLELEVCNNILDSADVLVMDRDLEVSVTNEDKFFDKLYENALKNNVVVCGLSKTTSLLTKKGNSVNALLNSLGNGKWYYKLVEGVYFVKLNDRSKYCFRLDVGGRVKYDINEVLSLLVENSKDPIFLGYPYGLISADKFARVSNDEKNYLRTMFMTKFGKKWENIDKYEGSLDAHSVLDKVC
ncbi:MAG: DNA double-strand break repair nuclease NurA [Nanoarchaeota archaeon]|nr:DNA double-strand break repair nuclease NurA [Nanoarchaeota archaeon]